MGMGGVSMKGLNNHQQQNNLRPQGAQASSNNYFNGFVSSMNKNFSSFVPKPAPQPALAGGMNSGFSTQSILASNRGGRSNISMSAARTNTKLYAMSEGATATLEGTFQKAVQKELPHGLDGFEPVLSKELMELHYGKHHATYVNNLNNLQEQAATALANGDHLKLTELTQGIKFNGGGHMNHEFFWDSLAPVGKGGGELPKEGSPLEKAISKAFGSIDDMIAHFSAQTAAVQGSGWGWLAYNKTTKEIEFRTTANQDRLVDQGAYLVPILTIDIWEHAYYVDY